MLANDTGAHDRATARQPPEIALPRPVKRPYVWPKPRPLTPDRDPWDRQPGEDGKAYASFVVYRDLGPHRRNRRMVSQELAKQGVRRSACALRVADALGVGAGPSGGTRTKRSGTGLTCARRAARCPAPPDDRGVPRAEGPRAVARGRGRSSSSRSRGGFSTTPSPAGPSMSSSTASLPSTTRTSRPAPTRMGTDIARMAPSLWARHLTNRMWEHAKHLALIDYWPASWRDAASRGSASACRRRKRRRPCLTSVLNSPSVLGGARKASISTGGTGPAC